MADRRGGRYSVLLLAAWLPGVDAAQRTARCNVQQAARAGADAALDRGGGWAADRVGTTVRLPVVCHSSRWRDALSCPPARDPATPAPEGGCTGLYAV